MLIKRGKNGNIFQGLTSGSSRSVIGFQNRPLRGLEEMNKGIIHNFNSIVRRDDILYIPGDLIKYRIPESQANELIKRINGRKILIRGNHDGH